MKKFVCVLFLTATVMAEPPRHRFARFGSERQELAEGNDKEPTSKSAEAPYAAAGFKPAKEFNLPSRQELLPPATSYGTPDDSYGAPFKTYTAPQVEYGVPETKAKESDGEEKKAKAEEGSAGEAESLKEEKKEKSGKLEEAPQESSDVVSAQGAYYVLLPGSQLQRIQFQTENDIRNMAYTARLQYRNEDRAPLFVYTAVPQYQSAAYVQLV